MKIYNCLDKGHPSRIDSLGSSGLVEEIIVALEAMKSLL